MILFVNGGTKTVYSIKEHREHLGVLYSPACGNSIERAIESRLPWAMDNGAFSGFDALQYERMVDKCSRYTLEGLRWVVCPDVVGDHRATLDLFDRWGMYLKRRRIPIAFVAQDGCTAGQVPWSEISCLFIGGSTQWKLSEAAQRLILIARMKATWVHVGRVNSRRRIRWCFDQGVTSIDGTSMSRFAETYLPKFLAHVAWLKAQMRLGEQPPRAILYPSSTKVQSPSFPQGAVIRP